MKKLFWLVLLTSGCSATLDTRLSKSSPNAPVNEIHGGVVSYLNQGYAFAVRARREDAYQKMHDYCAGPYKIVSEGQESGAGVATRVGASTVYGESQYWRIRFECVE